MWKRISIYWSQFLILSLFCATTHWCPWFYSTNANVQNDKHINVQGEGMKARVKQLFQAKREGLNWCFPISRGNAKANWQLPSLNYD